MAEAVSDPLEDARGRFEVEARRRLVGMVDSLGGSESPIERLLLWELITIASRHDVNVQIGCGWKFTDDGKLTGPRPWEVFRARAALFVTICQQVKVGQYRCDFVLEHLDMTAATEERRRLVVECDGHDFHERTKEQAARDKGRDRYFVERGLKVFRFTGSEIYRDVTACAAQAIAELVQPRGR